MCASACPLDLSPCFRSTRSHTLQRTVQANLLQCHGARFPTTSAGKAIVASVKKLQQASSFNVPDLEFVKDYKYTLGAEDLVLYGAQQSFDLGETDSVRYAVLLNKTSVPFVRASESGRIIDTARNWTAGVAYASNQQCIGGPS